MKTRRSLALKRESLAPLSEAQLGSVVGAQATLLGKCQTHPICFTDADRTTCLNCE